MKPDAGRGDDGTTSLFGGQRVGKDSARVEAYGTMDELNCAIGLARTAATDESIRSILAGLQADLFCIGSDLATPPDSPFRTKVPAIGQQQVVRLETLIDRFRDQLPPLSAFTLPGGCEPAARLHLARSICRRAERAVLRAIKAEPSINDQIIPYVNRLSDLLFELARWVNKQEGVADLPWTAGKRDYHGDAG